jgi:hypothetical protein
MLMLLVSKLFHLQVYKCIGAGAAWSVFLIHVRSHLILFVHIYYKKATDLQTLHNPHLKNLKFLETTLIRGFV